jgi:hypothetical protein
MKSTTSPLRRAGLAATAISAGALLATTASSGMAATADAGHAVTPRATAAKSPFVAPVRVSGKSVVSVAPWHKQRRHVLLAPGTKSPPIGRTILVGAGKKTPNGLLAKVVAVRRTAAGRLDVTTAPAPIQKALPPGTYGFEAGPSATPESAPHLANDGGEHVQKTVSFSCNGHVNNLKVDTSLTVRASVTGHVTITPLWAGIDATLHFADDASLRAVLDAAVDCKASFVVVDLSWPLYEIGVPGSLNVQVRIDVTAALHGHLELAAHHHLDRSVGIEWHTGEKQPVVYYGGTDGGFTVDKPILTGDGKLEGGITVSAGLNLLEVLKPHVNLTGYVGIQADLTKAPWWTVYDGVRGSAGVTVPLHEFGPWVFYNQTWTLASAVDATPPAMPRAFAAGEYAAQLQGVGGRGGPYKFTLAGGALPQGLALSSDGKITGLPAVAPSSPTTYSFTVGITDGAGGTGQRTESITVYNRPIVVISGAGVHEAFEPVDVHLDAVGAGPFTWAVGPLPAGWTWNAVTRTLHTEGLKVGSTTIPVTVTDRNGISGTATVTLTGKRPIETCRVRPNLPPICP